MLKSFILVQLFFIAVNSNASSFCENLFLDTQNISQANPRDEFFLPRDLKLRDEGALYLLRSEKHGFLIGALGKIFFIGERHPHFYEELANLVSNPKVGYKLIPELQGDFDHLWQKISGQKPDPNDKNYLATEELLLRLQSLSGEYYLTFEEAFVIAYLGRNKVNMSDEVLKARQLLNIDKSSANAYFDLIRSRFLEASKKPSFAKFFKDFAYGTLDRLHLPDYNFEKFGTIWTIGLNDGIGKYSISRAYLSDDLRLAQFKSSLKKLNDKLQLNILTTITFNELSGFINFVHFSNQEALKGKSFIDSKNELLNLVEEEFATRFPEIKTPDDIMNLLNFIYYGATPIDSPDSIRAALVEAAKSLLLPAKAELAQLKAEQHQAMQQQSLQNSKPIVVFSYPSEFIPTKIQTPNPNKRRNQTSTENSEAEPVSSKKQQSSKSENDLSRWFQEPNIMLRDNYEYTFTFIRNQQNGVQKIIFPKDIVEALNASPRERNKFIKAINLGYTAQNSKGTPGVKLLYAKGENDQNIYEVKPGDSSYRLIMIKQDGVWIVQKLLTKKEMRSY